jgi:hypothetical protein
MWHEGFAPSTWSNWALVIVGIAGSIAALLTLVVIWRQTVATEKTLVLTQRPQIVVRNFYFSEPNAVGGVYRGPKEIENGSFCGGQFYIVNRGGTPAKIEEIYCIPYITRTLPMKRPYEGMVGSKGKMTLRPGESAPYIFGMNTPLDESGVRAILTYALNFYVLGWIGYTDNLGIYRITSFCRHFDTTQNRFVPADNADYENSD